MNKMEEHPSQSTFYVPGTVLGRYSVCVHLCKSSQQCKAGITRILQMRKLRLGEVLWHGQAFSVSKQHWYSEHYCQAPKLHPSLCTRLRFKKKKKGSRRFSVRLEGNYSRRQNVIRFLSEAEVRERTARQSWPGEKVLPRSCSGRASWATPGLLRIWEPTWNLIPPPSFNSY